MSQASGEWTVRRATGEDGPLLAQLFERAGVPCFCQYYGFGGDHRQWQNRCANEPLRNREGLLRELESTQLESTLECGVLAVTQDQVVGWLRLAHPKSLRKLYENRLYRALPVLGEGNRDTTFALGCFLVDPNWRRRGVARALLGGALDLARSWGASAVEAFPRVADGVSDEEHWMGPSSLYEATGFLRVHDFAPYPVFRAQL
jgi:GNAT superfamily N-acetyltransferase